MAYEDLFPYIGDFGRYQKRIYLLLCLTAIPCGFHKLAGPFLMSQPDYRCKLPNELSNASFALSADELKMHYPIEIYSQNYSKCELFDTNFTKKYYETKVPANRSVNCDSYIYDDSKYKSSAVIEWTMVCSRAFLKAMADAIFMMGVLIGSIVFGQMSDSIGRKPVFFASLVLQVIFGVLAGVAPEYITFTISRFVIGATTSGVFLVWDIKNNLIFGNLF